MDSVVNRKTRDEKPAQPLIWDTSYFLKNIKTEYSVENNASLSHRKVLSLQTGRLHIKT